MSIEPIDTISRIIEYLLKFSERKTDVDRRLFENHIEPVYKDLQIIINDYHELIANTKEKIDDPAIPMSTIIKELEIRREKFARSRNELRKYSKLLSESSKKSKVGRFSFAVLNLLTLEPATIEKPSYMMSSLSSLIDDFKHVYKGRGVMPDSRRSYTSILHYYTSEIDDCWSEILDAYYQLKIECLK